VCWDELSNHEMAAHNDNDGGWSVVVDARRRNNAPTKKRRLNLMYAFAVRPCERRCKASTLIDRSIDLLVYRVSSLLMVVVVVAR